VVRHPLVQEVIKAYDRAEAEATRAAEAARASEAAAAESAGGGAAEPQPAERPDSPRS